MLRCKRCDNVLLLQSEKELALCANCQAVLNRPPLIESSFAHTDNELRPFVDDLYAFDYLADNPAPQHLPTRRCSARSLERLIQIVVAFSIPILVTVTVVFLEFDWLRQAKVTSREVISLIVLILGWWVGWQCIKEVVA